MKIKCILLLYLSLYYSWEASAQSAHLPIGKRRYLLENNKPYSPVDIGPLKGEGTSRAQMKQATMLDPIPLGSQPILSKDSHLGVPSGERPKRMSRMVFDQVAVKGRYLVPRVSFDRPEIEVGRSEEPTQVDYRAKIKASEAILKDFDW